MRLVRVQYLGSRFAFVMPMLRRRARTAGPLRNASRNDGVTGDRAYVPANPLGLYFDGAVGLIARHVEEGFSAGGYPCKCHLEEHLLLLAKVAKAAKQGGAGCG